MHVSGKSLFLWLETAMATADNRFCLAMEQRKIQDAMGFTKGMDLLRCPNTLGLKLKESNFSIPPKDPKELKKWFKSIVHRKKDDSSPSESSQFPNVDTPEEKTNKSAVTPSEHPVQLSLRETDTVWLLSIDTSYCPLEAGSDSSQNRSQDLGVGIKRTEAESQTPKLPEKRKGSETVDIRVKNSFINASAWDLYDTYAQVGEEAGFGIKEFQLLIDTALKSRGVLAAQVSSSETTRLPAEKQMKLLLKTDEFQYSLLVAERMLASKTFQRKQCLLKEKQIEKNGDVPSSNFSYDIAWLWSYDFGPDPPSAVTAMDWNPQNPGLLAVGYEERNKGFICIWSPKNPSHPERQIHTESAVTSLCYSKTRPNVLAAGCKSGEVLIIDFSSTEGVVHRFPKGNVETKFGPLWRVEWFFENSQNTDKEDLIAIGESGVLLHLSLGGESPCREVLALKYTTQVTSLSSEPRIEFMAKTLSGLWFSLVPDKQICYVSTNEGVIVKCIIRKPCHTDIQLSAHLGPVYVIQHSPVASMIFLTCGADHSFKIWVEGIEQPLLTLNSSNKETMIFAQWSPVIPTMIATLSDFQLELWDLARKFNEPVSSLRIRSSDLGLSTLRFFPNGKGIVIGDRSGHVGVYQLSQLPREPFLKVEALTGGIQAALEKEPVQLQKFNKIVQFQASEFKTKVI